MGINRKCTCLKMWKSTCLANKQKDSQTDPEPDPDPNPIPGPEPQVLGPGFDSD